MANYRLVFAGTPAFAAAHLSALLKSPHEVIGVFTQPDRPSGRGKKLQPSPVKRLAQENNLPVYQPASLRNEEQQELLRQLQPDILIVVAYGLILPPAVLEIPKYGCLNVHASLLPRWRGAAPIERALLAGDEVTGVTIMQMDEGLDTGDMLYKSNVDINATDTRADLEDKLAECGSKALLHCLEHLEELVAVATRQDDSASTYAPKLEKSEALIDWNQSADQIDRLIRAGIGRFPAYTFFDDIRLRLLHATPSTDFTGSRPGLIVAQHKDGFQVACKDSSLYVDRVQLPAKNPVAVRDILNSRPELFATGKSFSTEPTSN